MPTYSEALHEAALNLPQTEDQRAKMKLKNDPKARKAHNLREAERAAARMKDTHQLVQDMKAILNKK